MTTHLTAQELAAASWRKSTYSGGGGNACIEVAPLPALDVVAVRDSKTTDSPVIPVTGQAWTALLVSLSG